MVPDPRQRVGRIGERLALEHFERLGYRLVARNHRTRWGEIDLIVFDGATLVFAEVKTRRAGSLPVSPWEALHERKRAQVRAMARAYLHEADARPSARAVRFDAVGVLLDQETRLVRLDHLEGAF